MVTGCALVCGRFRVSDPRKARAEAGFARVAEFPRRRLAGPGGFGKEKTFSRRTPGASGHCDGEGKKRQRTGAVQDAARGWGSVCAPSVLDCACPLALLEARPERQGTDRNKMRPRAPGHRRRRPPLPHFFLHRPAAVPHSRGMEPLTADEIRRAVQAALAEDIGTGDVTTLATVPENASATAVMVARESLVLAGIAFAEEAFTQLYLHCTSNGWCRTGRRRGRSASSCACRGRRAPSSARSEWR